MRISVITACKNSAETLPDTLESIASQSHNNIDHVVIDGDSSDDTLDILRGSGLGSRIFSQPDAGIYDALNKGLSYANGDVVGFLHADDMYEHQQVLALVAQAFADPAVDAVYGDLSYVSRGNAKRVVRNWRAGTYSDRKLSWGWMPPHPSFYARRHVYERLGQYDERYSISADYDWMLRFFSGGGFNVAYIPQSLVRMRMGGMSNRSFSNILRKSREDYLALQRNRIGGLGALCYKNLSKLSQFI